MSVFGQINASLDLVSLSTLKNLYKFEFKYIFESNLSSGDPYVKRIA